MGPATRSYFEAMGNRVFCSGSMCPKVLLRGDGEPRVLQWEHVPKGLTSRRWGTACSAVGACAQRSYFAAMGNRVFCSGSMCPKVLLSGDGEPRVLQWEHVPKGLTSRRWGTACSAVGACAQRS